MSDTATCYVLMRMYGFHTEPMGVARTMNKLIKAVSNRYDLNEVEVDTLRRFSTVELAIGDRIYISIVSFFQE